MQDNQIANVLQNRENSMNFIPNFAGDSQLTKITPIGTSKLLNVLVFKKLFFKIMLLLFFSPYAATTANYSNAAHSCAKSYDGCISANFTAWNCSTNSTVSSPSTLSRATPTISWSTSGKI